MKKLGSFLIIALLVALFVGSGVWGLSAVQQAGAQANTACYGEQGGAKQVAGDGCEYEFQAGSTLTVDGTADFSGATLTGISTSTLTSLTVSGNALVSDTLTVSGTTELNDDLDMNAQPIVNIGNAGTDFGTDGGLTLAAGLTVTAGNTDLGGTLQFGAANLYPLGYASANQQVVCGTTTFTETSKVTPTGLTTVTYALATQVTTPAATGAFLTVSDPTTSTFNIYSWEADYSEGTTPVAAHWCAVGDQ